MPGPSKLPAPLPVDVRQREYPLAIATDGRYETIRDAANFLAREIMGDVMASEEEISDAIAACIIAHRRDAVENERATARGQRDRMRRTGRAREKDATKRQQ